MEIQLGSEKIHYHKKGAGEAVVLLHGWGMSKETFTSLEGALSEDYLVYSIDLMGFGASPMTKPYDLDDYINTLRAFIISEEIDSPILLGHSFGGRIAIRYASRFDVSALVLTASAGIKKKLSIFKKAKIHLYRVAKKCRITLPLGSKDYRNANPFLRRTLVNIVNTDQQEELMRINAPALLLWGKQDKETPLSDGKKMESLLSNGALVVIDKCGHFPYIEKYRYFLIVLKAFLREVEK